MVAAGVRLEELSWKGIFSGYGRGAPPRPTDAFWSLDFMPFAMPSSCKVPQSTCAAHVLLEFGPRLLLATLSWQSCRPFQPH